MSQDWDGDWMEPEGCNKAGSQRLLKAAGVVSNSLQSSWHYTAPVKRCEIFDRFFRPSSLLGTEAPLRTRV